MKTFHGHIAIGTCTVEFDVSTTNYEHDFVVLILSLDGEYLRQ